jgi:hypothetical protein
MSIIVKNIPTDLGYADLIYAQYGGDVDALSGDFAPVPTSLYFH